MNDNQFNFTYSAAEQAEIKEIRSKYSPVDEPVNKMEELRRLDASATQKATMSSLVLGIVGALILGLGMSLVMTDLGALLGMGKTISMVLGVIIGILGIGPVCMAYPTYNRVLKREQERIAPEILRLTDELMK